MTKPLAIDLFCGLGGWTEGLLADGYFVVGFDIQAHEYGDMRYPGKLVIQDVLTLHGSQFRDAALIVASPPCQEYSYMAMPWKLAKAKAKAIREDATGAKLATLNALFAACFRIQSEACAAAGRHIPMVVENVRGAETWVGRARWKFGSFYLWGDVPALMPTPGRRAGGVKAPGMNWSDPEKRGQDFTRLAGKHASAYRPASGAVIDRNGGVKIGGDWFSDSQSTCRKHASGSPGRKMASAMIAKIPLALSRHIGAVYLPKRSAP